MPIVRIQIAQRSTALLREDKLTLIQGITDVVEQVLGKRRDSITVLIEELSPDNWAEGGRLVSDIRRDR
jgi:4-oxalocrotonate tautomerase